MKKDKSNDIDKGFDKANAVYLLRQKEFRNDRKNPNQLPLITDEIVLRIRNMKQEIYWIGRALTDGKKLQDHGDFQPWVEKNFDFSYPTANNIMNVYRTCIGRPELVQSFQSSVLYKIAAPKFPEDLREHLFEHGDHLEKIDNETINRVCKKYKAGKIGLKDPDIKNLMKYNKRVTNHQHYQHRIDKSMAILKDLNANVQRTVNAIEWPNKTEKPLKVTKLEAKKIKDMVEDIVNAIQGIQPKMKTRANTEPVFALLPSKAKDEQKRSKKK